MKFLSGLGKALAGIGKAAVKNPKSTLAGVTAIAGLAFPEHAAKITTVATVALGVLSADAKPEEAEKGK